MGLSNHHHNDGSRFSRDETDPSLGIDGPIASRISQSRTSLS